MTVKAIARGWRVVCSIFQAIDATLWVLESQIQLRVSDGLTYFPSVHITVLVSIQRNFFPQAIKNMIKNHVTSERISIGH